MSSVIPPWLPQSLCSTHARECEDHCKEEVAAAEGGKKGGSSRASKQAVETCKWRCTLSSGSPCLAVRRPAAHQSISLTPGAAR